MIYLPELPVCNDCSRLEIEFAQALEDAQAAAADAQEAAENAETEARKAEQAEQDISGVQEAVAAMLVEAREILDQIRGAGIGKYTQTFITTANQSQFTFAPQGYEYNVSDYFNVYVNGLKLLPEEFTRADNVITLVTPISLANQKVEIEAWTASDTE